jgi:hypothetical protein
MVLLGRFGPSLPWQFNVPFLVYHEGIAPNWFPVPVWLAMDLLVNSRVDLVAVILLFWIGFARPRGRERWLLVGGVYLTSLLARSLISDALSAPGGYRILDPIAVYSTIAFGGLLFLVDRSALPDAAIRILGTALVLAVIVALVFPVLAGYAIVSDVLASVCFDGMIFSLAVAFAQFNGVDIFRRSASSPEQQQDLFASGS